MLEPWRALRGITSTTFKGRWASSAARNRPTGVSAMHGSAIERSAISPPADRRSSSTPDRAPSSRTTPVSSGSAAGEEAAACLERVVEDYEHQSALARAVAEDCFDARRVTARALEVAV